VGRLEERALRIRRHIVRMTHLAGSGHPGGSLSATDVFAALYFRVMRHDPKNPGWEERDRFVLSKGHACVGLYATLAESGYFPVETLDTLRKLGSPLQGHPEVGSCPGIEAPAGSEGQAFGMAIGMAIAGKMDKRHGRVWTMLGDGECDAGPVWEGAMIASAYKLDNLTAILDRNRIQQDDFCDKVLPTEPMGEKWRAMGWHVIEIDGHSMTQVVQALEASRTVSGKPTMIVAQTVKGKGVGFMENNVDWHGKGPNKEQYEAALRELGGAS
jgi:transketolase